MRNILFAIAVLFSFSCKAQTLVKSLYEDDTDITGAYYKDLYNDFDNFVGTWIYTNGSTSLTITLQKNYKFTVLKVTDLIIIWILLSVSTGMWKMG